MEYTLKRAFRMLRWNRWSSLLMIAEMILGISIFVYSTNLSQSLLREEVRIRENERDLVLEITHNLNPEDESGEYTDELPFDMEDYEKLQDLTKGNTFFYITAPQFFSVTENNYEFQLVFIDYEKFGLEEQYTYWGEDLLEQVKPDLDAVNPFPVLEAKRMSESLNKKRWENAAGEIALKECVTAPLSFIEQMKSEISAAGIHVEWSSFCLTDMDMISQRIVQYLENEHGEKYRYRIYSPEDELRNHAYKVKIALQTLNKAGILVLFVFFIGMLSVFQLQFEHRKEKYGVFLACGADMKQLAGEIMLEIAIINGTGTVLGISGGFLLTGCRYIELMIGDVAVHGYIVSVFYAVLFGISVTAAVWIFVLKKLGNKTIVELLNDR